MIDYEGGRPFYGLGRKERLKTALLAAAGICAVSAAGFFGLFYKGWLIFPGNNNVFYIDHGTLVRDSWVDGSEEEISHTDPDARRVIGLYETDDGFYCFDGHGRKLTGWQEQEDGTRYFGEDGRMSIGWEETGGEEYFFADDGTLCTGWLEDSGHHYRLQEDGSRVEGWAEIEGKTYYFDEATGEMQTGWFEQDNEWFLFADDGSMLTGEQQEGDQYYLLREDGTRYSGWKASEEGKRFYAQDGHALIGWNEVDGNLMYFDEKGFMQSGRIELDGEAYYLEEDGTVSPGWHETVTEDEETTERFYVCRDGFILDSTKENGNSGRLIIHDCGIDVALNKAWSRDEYQTVTDAEDSALVVQERHDLELVIADRKSQGFEIGKAVEKKSFAYIIDSKGNVTEFVCESSSLGRNTGEDVVDSENLSVWKQNEGGFCTYTSAGNGDPEAVRIVFWKPV